MNWQCIYTYPGEGNGTPFQYSCLENPMDGGAWKAAVHGVAEGQTQLSDFTFPFHFHALEKEMATHSSVLAWGIPGTGDPGGLLSMGSYRVGHNWSDLAAGIISNLLEHSCLNKVSKDLPLIFHSIQLACHWYSVPGWCSEECLLIQAPPPVLRYKAEASESSSSKGTVLAL